MQALPASPLEAAQVDGASTLQRLRLIIVPMLRPVIVVAVIFRSAEAVREFDKVFVLTGGGPGSASEVLDLFSYRVAFVNWDMSLFKTISLKERARLQLRLEAFNAFNHTEWGATTGGNGINAAAQFNAAGQIVNLPSQFGGTGGRFGFGAENTIRANSQRILQIAVKFNF